MAKASGDKYKQQLEQIFLLHYSLYICIVATHLLYSCSLLQFSSAKGATQTGGGERDDKLGQQRKTGQYNVLIEQLQRVWGELISCIVCLHWETMHTMHTYLGNRHCWVALFPRCVWSSKGCVCKRHFLQVGVSMGGKEFPSDYRASNCGHFRLQFENSNDHSLIQFHFVGKIHVSLKPSNFRIQASYPTCS